jgi:hypothetical protein
MYEPKGEKGEAVAGAFGLVPKGLVLLGEEVLVEAMSVDPPCPDVESIASIYEPKGLLGAVGLGLDATSFLGVLPAAVLSIELM